MTISRSNTLSKASFIYSHVSDSSKSNSSTMMPVRPSSFQSLPFVSKSCCSWDMATAGVQPAHCSVVGVDVGTPVGTPVGTLVGCCVGTLECSGKWPRSLFTLSTDAPSNGLLFVDDPDSTRDFFGSRSAAPSSGLLFADDPWSTRDLFLPLERSEGGPRFATSRPAGSVPLFKSCVGFTTAGTKRFGEASFAWVAGGDRCAGARRVTRRLGTPWYTDQRSNKKMLNKRQRKVHLTVSHVAARAAASAGASRSSARVSGAASDALDCRGPRRVGIVWRGTGPRPRLRPPEAVVMGRPGCPASRMAPIMPRSLAASRRLLTSTNSCASAPRAARA